MAAAALAAYLGDAPAKKRLAAKLADFALLLALAKVLTKRDFAAACDAVAAARADAAAGVAVPAKLKAAVDAALALAQD